MFEKGEKVIYRGKAHDGGDDYYETGVFVGITGSFIVIDTWDSDKRVFTKMGHNLADIDFIRSLEDREATPDEVDTFSAITITDLVRRGQD